VRTAEEEEFILEDAGGDGGITPHTRWLRAYLLRNLQQRFLLLLVQVTIGRVPLVCIARGRCRCQDRRRHRGPDPAFCCFLPLFWIAWRLSDCKLRIQGLDLLSYSFFVRCCLFLFLLRHVDAVEFGRKPTSRGVKAMWGITDSSQV
jgi:hypothetical protein